MIPFDVVALDTPYDKKPIGYEIGVITNRIKSNPDIVTITNKDDLINLINTKGSVVAWSDSGTRMVMIDFDKGTTLNNALISAKKKGLLPTLVYKTHSEKYEGISKTRITRFRFVYLLDDMIKTVDEYKAIYSAFLKIFHMADRQVRNPNRLFFTGNNHHNKIVYDGDILPMSILTPLLASNYIEVSKNVNIKPKHTKTIKELPKNNLTNYLTLNGVDHTEVRSICKLYESHYQNEQLTHFDKMILLTNLRYVNGGVNFFINNLIEGRNTKRVAKWENIAHFVEKNNYKPFGCSMCSKKDSCPNSSNKNLRSVIMNRSKVEKLAILDEEVYQTIDEARNDVNRYIKSCLNDKYDSVYVIQVPAAIGKTQTVLESYHNECVLAFPNHKLKQEKYDWMMSNGKHTYQTMDIKEIVTDEKDLEEITDAFKSNNIKRIKEIVLSYKGGLEYWQRRRIPLTNNTMTTHEKTLNGNYSSDVFNVIYDEDPSSSMVVYNNWNYKKALKDLNILKSKNIISKDDKDILVKVLRKWSKIDTYEPEYIKETKLIKSVRKLAKSINSKLKTYNIQLHHNIVHLLHSISVSKSAYMVDRRFPAGRRIIILSATPDIDTIKKLAKKSGKDFKLLKLSKQVKRVGKIKQVLVNTSKNKIDDNLDIIKQYSKAEHTITYKSKVGTFNKNIDNIPYGGNTTGYNNLKGKDIDIVYTLQARPDYYRMKYAFLYDKQLKDNRMVNQKVEWGKSRFIFYAPIDEDYRKIIFQHIDSEMVQAIERSRTLTENCTSTVFSNFVCSIVDPYNIIYI